MKQEGTAPADVEVGVPVRRKEMEGWIPAGGHFIEPDVTRWTEGVFGPRRGKSIRARKLGERIVTAGPAVLSG